MLCPGLPEETASGDRLTLKSAPSLAARYVKVGRLFRLDLVQVNSSMEHSGAVIPFIHSDAATDNSDFIAYFAGMLEFRLEHEPQELVPVAGQLAALCAYVTEHWASFQKGAEFYGNVWDRFESLRDAFSRLT